MKKTVLRIVLAVLISHLCLILFGGPGYRLGLWGFKTGLGFVLWAVYVAPVAFVVSLCLIKGHSRQVTLNLGLAVLLLSIPLSFKSKVNSVPRIHDISTNVNDPPEFKWVGELRKAGDHPIAYEGVEAGKAQQIAYPDIKTLDIPTPPSDAFQKAKRTVEKMKWTLVKASEEEGQIEASYTSLLYGFKDDIAIRIRAVGGNTTLDIRSQSRVGISDLGANAARIRSFVKEFQSYSQPMHGSGSRQ